MIISLISLVLMGASSQAALPPYYDRAVQIKTVLESKDVYDAVTGNQITSIRYVGTEKNGTYNFALTTTSVCRYNVYLDSVVPSNKPGEPILVGPTQYVVKNIDTVCIP